ncbi:hypothetical protein ACFW6K_14790 [Streptomyces sp. NPDC058733]|uniref:hypothetical protein n=1 Tax=unclassified Streptomyces TaxID=2593676 RepID=UPI003652B24C
MNSPCVACRRPTDTVLRFLGDGVALVRALTDLGVHPKEALFLVSDFLQCEPVLIVVALHRRIEELSVHCCGPCGARIGAGVSAHAEESVYLVTN